MRRAWLLVAALPILSGFTCGHVQDEGVYLFSQTQLLSDPCQIVQTPASVAQVTLTVIGNDPRMDGFTYAGATFQLVGMYEWNIEQFFLDGTVANVPVTASGQTCTVDQINVSVTAITDDATHFHGTLRIEYEAHTQAACQCQASLNYSAVHQ